MFEAGDTFHHQTSGTAMATTPSTLTYTTVYYDFRGIIKLLVKHARHFVHYKRYIPDLAKCAETAHLNTVEIKCAETVLANKCLAN